MATDLLCQQAALAARLLLQAAAELRSGKSTVQALATLEASRQAMQQLDKLLLESEFRSKRGERRVPTGWPTPNALCRRPLQEVHGGFLQHDRAVLTLLGPQIAETPANEGPVVPATSAIQLYVAP